MSYDSAELREESELPLYGENLARSLSVSGAVSGAAAGALLQGRLRQLKSRHRALSSKYVGGDSLPPEAEWLLDNYYLVLREGEQAISDLRQAGRLPESGGECALYPLCLGLVRSGGGRVTLSRMELFFEGCQRVYILSRRELSVLLPMLRAAIIEQLCELYAGDCEGEAAVSAERLFTSLRMLSVTDFTDLISDIDRAEQLLLTDPAGVYPEMSEKTREDYKRRLERLAKKAHMSEHHLAEHLLRLARTSSGEGRHIGYYLFTRTLDRPPRKHRGTLYISLLFALSLAAALLAGLLLDSFAAAALMLLPAYSIIKALIDSVLLKASIPTHLPRMELPDGVPVSGRTLCVITALLTGADDGKRLAKKLEEYRLASRDCGENLLFGILGDLPDSEAQELHTDEALLRSMDAAITELNEKYSGGFYFFIRRRQFSRRAGHYMAWERKRGAVMELARHLSGAESGIISLSGSDLGLRGVKNILTLDEDTRLTPGCARELIGAMLHPLNSPVIDEARRIVVSGHGLIHPRISVELSAAKKTPFSRIFSPQGGCDPYGSDSSELYMDVFQNGGFAGKGIISVEALLTCLDRRIPDDAVLSHDALEGAYLRGGFMGDAELTDSFPSSLLSYQRRAHRWMRGDWQNSPWIFRRGRHLAPIDRFRLFDSIRRATEPIFVLAAVLGAFLFPSPAMTSAGLLALLSLSLPLIKITLGSLFQPAKAGGAKNRSGLLSPRQEAFRRLCFELLLLPYNAVNALSAGVLSLWRMLITRRHLLDWATFSAMEKSPNSALRALGSVWPSLLLSSLALFSPLPLGKASGIFWLLSPFVVWELSRPKTKGHTLSEEDRSYLLQTAARMWSYFSEFCTPREHYLPPDNFQQQPEEQLAHRSSPTNIGLCLLSALSAIDLELCPRQEALGLIENILATLRRMPKWKGNLYNWYDTETLRPLHPAYVSTVDSGNLVACLLVLRQGLLELEQERLAQQCNELLAPMSLAPLYDESRRLFSIGWDAEKEALSPGCYDLMASEAQITSFVAISRGDAPKKHWRQLSRALAEHCGYRGMASWTGSMFEYMMPRLFFSAARGSLIYETQRFCVAAQISRAKGLKLPWGISESAYYSLDAALSYRYKAHGCAALALKRGMDSELVVSPYSSLIALPCAPAAALKNLRALEKAGLSCSYGFWEAVDFTPDRCDRPGGQIVHCVMAHHIGMSILAVTNLLREDVMPRRLMSVPEMSAYSILLDEKLPMGGIVLRRREKRPPARPARSSAVYWEQRGDFAAPAAPACCALSNGLYSLLLTDSGVSRAAYRGIAPYYTPDSDLEGFCGIDLRLFSGGELTPLLPSPDMPEGAKSDWEFTLTGAKINTTRSGLRSQVVFLAPSDISGEKRIIAVSPEDGSEKTAELIISLRPLLLPAKEFSSHPAFAMLGIHAKTRGGALILRRLPRGGTPETFMCIAASEPLSCFARGELLPARGGGLDFLSEKLEAPLGWLNEPYVFASMPIRVAEGAEHAATLVLTVGGSENEVYSSACRLLTGDGGGSSYSAECAARLGLTEKETAAAMALLPELRFPRPSPLPRRELWSFGISGDLPVLVRSASSAEELSEAEAHIRALSFLSSLGCAYDLVLLCDEGGDYLRPVSDALSALCRKIGADSSRIHILQRGEKSELILSLSAVSRERDSYRTGAYMLSDPLTAPKQDSPDYGWLPDGSFFFHVSRSLPPRAWSNVLSNGSFGYLASDCGTGYMWYKNAREYAINRRPQSQLSVLGSEALLLDGQSLFASPEDSDCTVTYGPGFAKWEKPVGSALCSMTAFVPPDTDARVLLLQWAGSEVRELLWSLDLVLGGGEQPDGISISRLGGLFRVHAPAAPFENADFLLCTSGELTGFSSSREEWLRGEIKDTLTPADSLCLRLESSSPLVLVCGCDDEEKLRALCSVAAALAALDKTREYWRQKISAVQIETPLPALDRLINVWLPYQTLCCRLLGRCSMYQSGGAVGFRDQLQDAVNLIILDSSLARAQILDCCRHQYTEGDVMHWWHALSSGDRGVRTRCSDDLLWLAWALCEYTEKTGDFALCFESVPWLCSPPLAGGEHDRYEQAAPSPSHSCVLEHAIKALDMILSRGVGAHGLLKLGGGDWNDGFSLAGAEGRGESVWLTWFFSHTAERFAALLTALERPAEAKKYSLAAESLGKASNSAWDGNWYLRGYFDDGSPLGGSECENCKIDSLSQSFAALCKVADKGRINTALSSAVTELFDRNSRVISLFTPPFEDARPSPGYIQSYGPGFRENGGQYTHGAVWLIMALLSQNRRSEALELLSAIIPELHDNKVYQAEPFVLAADVYSNPDCPGRAGWSWYTGAAGWLYRVVTEELLGLKLKNGALTLSPRIPSAWSNCHILYRSPAGNISEIIASGGASEKSDTTLNKN